VAPARKEREKEQKGNKRKKVEKGRAEKAKKD